MLSRVMRTHTLAIDNVLDASILCSENPHLNPEDKTKSNKKRNSRELLSSMRYIVSLPNRNICGSTPNSGGEIILIPEDLQCSCTGLLTQLPPGPSIVFASQNQSQLVSTC